MSLPEEMISFYTDKVSETNRLESGIGVLERIRIRAIMQRYLPAPPALICDIGGATGAHAFWLASLGYDVHLLDPVPAHIELARQIAEVPDTPRLASVEVGDARHLIYADAIADAVLLFGPVYHLTDWDDRAQALAEARRVLRPGGLLFAVGISCYASTIVGLIQGDIWHPDYLAMATRELTTGEHIKPAGLKVSTDAHFHHPDELRAELEDAGFCIEATLGIQGPGWMVPDLEENLADDERREMLLNIAALMEREPVLSPHFVAVARHI